MNINDPFGRLQKQRQRDYESLRRSLQSSGLSNRADAERLLDKLRKRCQYGLMIIIPVTLLLLLLIPEWRIASGATGTLAGLWLVNTSRRARQYVARYIEEELTDNGNSEPF